MTRVPVPPERKRLDLIIPRALVAEIAPQADANNRSLTQEIIVLLREALAARAKRRR